jgi:hypothetical protein
VLRSHQLHKRFIQHPAPLKRFCCCRLTSRSMNAPHPGCPAGAGPAGGGARPRHRSALCAAPRRPRVQPVLWRGRRRHLERRQADDAHRAQLRPRAPSAGHAAPLWRPRGGRGAHVRSLVCSRDDGWLLVAEGLLSSCCLRQQGGLWVGIVRGLGLTKRGAARRCQTHDGHELRKPGLFLCRACWWQASPTWAPTGWCASLRRSGERVCVCVVVIGGRVGGVGGGG